MNEQLPDDGSYEEQFDRTEMTLGLISQDLADVAAPDTGGRSRGARWSGRATWRVANRRSDPLGNIRAQLDSDGDRWAPLTTGLFGGRLERARATLEDYSISFDELVSRRF